MRCVHCLALSCAVTALLPSLAGAQSRVQYNINSRLGGELATRPQQAENGRLWIGRPVIGGRESQGDYGWGEPGPAAYGAHEYDFSTVHARVGAVVSSLSPWERVRGSGNHSLEAARQKWLEERGYTGGVRTFVNDLYLTHDEDDADEVAAVEPRKAIEPRATIHLPIDQPRFKSRMHVRAGEAPAPRQASAAPGRGSSVIRVITSQPEQPAAEQPKEAPAAQIAAKDDRE